MPKFGLGELIYLDDEDDFFHIINRWDLFDSDEEEILYELHDLTHTTRKWWYEEDLMYEENKRTNIIIPTEIKPIQITTKEKLRDSFWVD